MKNKNLAIIVLAAGKGTRMKSSLPKVLHPVCGRPMLDYVQDIVKGLRNKELIFVLGCGQEDVKKRISPGARIKIQESLKGTADAVKEALGLLKNFKGQVLVLYGDNPLIKRSTIKKLLDYHFDNNLDLTLLSATMNKPPAFGRILRDKYAGICGIIEEVDANAYQKEIKEINTGIMVFDKDKLGQGIKSIRPHNRKKEYYLTDIVGIFYKKGYLIDSVKVEDNSEILGINSRVELAQANKIIQSRINRKMMESGVTLLDPGSTHIDYGVKIGKDTVIYPFTVIEKNVKIGNRCSIGPFIHLREGARLENEVFIGNFIEIVRSKIGKGTFSKHFSYIGDTTVGRDVNIGAGTVTANFDGKRKHISVIRDKAFIGSDTVLVAPVVIGKGAKTGAGAIVLKNNNVKSNQVVAGVPAKPLNQKNR